MSSDLGTIARQCGIEVEWQDAAGEARRVEDEVLLAVLAALGFPCETAAQRRRASRDLRSRQRLYAVTAEVGRPFMCYGRRKAPSHVVLENRQEKAITAKRRADGFLISPINEPGYHTLICGKDEVQLIVAPQRCFGIDNVVGTDRVWGIAAQTYSIGRALDGGIGHWGSIGELATLLAPFGADAVAISPSSAVRLAGLERFEPYGPSNRLFLNPLLADATVIFPSNLVKQEWHDVLSTSERERREAANLIDWKASAEAKLRLFRRLFDSSFFRREYEGRFEDFRQSAGVELQRHALHETLSAHFFAARKTLDWREWPERFRSPNSKAVYEFGSAHSAEMRFHEFLQWLASESLSAAQVRATGAGMRIGIITDLTVGISPQGSQAWSEQAALLRGLHVGAPPDAFNSNGQNWGLTTFSPFALRETGFASFSRLLRAAMQSAGGVRVDHIIGLGRLWVIPTASSKGMGAYIRYPFQDLLRILSLEAWRNRAIVIGEDLGTVPRDFSARLAEKNIFGTRVLWFERTRNRFTPARRWLRPVMATTTTHDLPTTAGWWRGRDAERISERKRRDAARDERKRARSLLWKAFRDSGVARGPEPAPHATARVVDAAISFIAETSSSLAILPIEDILGFEHQPNVPGTVTEHPNWRARFPIPVDRLLIGMPARRRLASIARRRAK